MGARGILEIVDVMYGDWRYRLDGMIDRWVLPKEEMKRELIGQIMATREGREHTVQTVKANAKSRVGIRTH